MENENQYLNLLKYILEKGHDTSDRTGTGTLSVFGHQMRFNLQEGFPLLTTKKVFWRGVVEELLWILSGSTNNNVLVNRGVNIWNEWADKETGDLGPVYGKQWRDWKSYKVNFIGDTYSECETASIDQIKNVIDRIKTKPDCRRLIVSAWNPADIDTMALPPCHCFYQFKVYGKKLNCHLYQRSADMFLGVPFNIASYALLTHLIANECDLEVGEFIHTTGDAHIYKNHIDQAKLQLSRELLPPPTLSINLHKGDLLSFIDSYRNRSWESSDGTVSITDVIQLYNYKSHPSIKAEVAV